MQGSNYVITTCLVLIASSAVLAEFRSCFPNLNCKLPNCRCYNDPDIPGMTTASETPQMVLLTFSYGINNDTADQYMSLFKGLANPNGCPATGTFFVERDNTVTGCLKKLHDASHELAVTVADDKIPTSVGAWTDSLAASLWKIKRAGIPLSAVKGVRGPELYMGGDDQMTAMDDLDLGYDASCMTVTYTEKGNLMWPFTYDYNMGSRRRCDIGKNGTKNFPGMWQFSVPVMKYKGRKCSTLAACSELLHTSDDTFNMIHDTFQKHYKGRRSPMVIFVNPDWFDKGYQVEGLIQFLDFIRQKQDTWLLTMTQALQWVKYPVPMVPGIRFMPFECDQEKKIFTTK